MTSTLEKPQMQDAQTPEHSQKQDAEMQEQPQTHDNEPQDEQREEQTTTEQNENNGMDVETNAPVFDEQQEENNEEETPQENETNVETPVETADHEEDQIAETPQEKSVATPATQKTVTQVPASTSATKRKFDALHARNLALEPSISEHEKNKKARASALMKSPATKVAETKSATARKFTKTREFSFARPTASSARRTAAAATDHARAKATMTLPGRKPLHAKNNKYTPAKAQRASMPVSKTSAIMDKASRPHFNYTPYSGPLPALTVESSFAPKNVQGLERGARTASPARAKPSAAVKKVPSYRMTARPTEPPSNAACDHL
ncbi:hypothetical protein PRNP1_013555 [Phytophthora ramorum]